MTQLLGYVHPNFPSHKCMLKKAIYSLKQVLRAWFSRLSSKLLELSFVSSHLYSSLFILRQANTIIYM